MSHPNLSYFVFILKKKSLPKLILICKYHICGIRVNIIDPPAISIIYMLCRVIIWSISTSHESQLDHYVYQEIILHGNPVMLQSSVINFKC